MKSRFFPLILIVLIFVVSCSDPSSSVSTDTYGRVFGSIGISYSTTDDGNIPICPIRLLQNSNEKYTTDTDSSGEFDFVQVLSGTYDLEVTYRSNRITLL